LEDRTIKMFQMPIHWSNESSGLLANAIDAYLDWAADGGLPPTGAQAFHIQIYLRQWINGSVWGENAEGDLEKIRLEVELIDSIEDIRRCIDSMVKIGADPL
jgi:hypothetical protein